MKNRGKPFISSRFLFIVAKSFFILFVLQLLISQPANATLPYQKRYRAYSGEGTTAIGDIRTVGMSGATIGLSDTFIAASFNPAGLAMSLNNADANISKSNSRDEHIQGFAAPLESKNMGACVNLYPWGLSLGFIAPYREGEKYSLQNFPQDPALFEVETKKFQISGARVFANNKISIGAGLIFAQSETKLNFENLTYLNKQNKEHTFSAVFGSSFQLPHRILIGLSYELPSDFEPDTIATKSDALEGYAQKIKMPSRLSLGVGWIPNRIFRADFSLHLLGKTEGASLIRNQKYEVGNQITLQPKLGIAYQFADYKSFNAVAFLGTYYEVSRILGLDDRLHFTWGIETKAWIFTLGWAIDTADSYKNYLASFGVDLIRVMSKLYLIPKPQRPAPRGFFPNPFYNSDEGLARALVKDWHPSGPDLNPFTVSARLPSEFQKLPKNLPYTLINTGEELEQLGKDMLDAFRILPQSDIPKAEELKGP